MLFKASFSQKIVGTIFLLLVFFIATVGAISYQVLQVQRQTVQTISDDIPQLIRLANLRYNILQLRRAEKDISIDLSMRPDAVIKRTEQWNTLSLLCLKIVDETVTRASGESLVSLQKVKGHLQAYVDQSKKHVNDVASKSLLEMASFETGIEKPKTDIRKAEELVTKQIAAMRETTDTGSVVLADNIGLVWWSIAVGLGITLVTALLAGLALLRSLKTPVAELGRGISEIKAGNLQHVLRVTSQDELGQMSIAFNDMVADLRSTVGNVRLAGEGVANASSEIAQGNNDLSARTEQQASALQQTAAAMEQLSGAVRHTAESAKEANRLATSASQFAVKGGDAVAKVSTTMKDIEESSSKIASIIQVIDGIAFQTNILALNAAVEAARAGEQGRGFAVVASEVRALAGRSSAAAKEIKILISASEERVALGSTLVGQAGATMSEVVQAIQRVSQIMGTIDSATNEQAGGVTQVGQAVSQMDQTTQQNAALVEEIAAAAASLKVQANDLVATVSVFNIGQPVLAAHHTQSAPRPRQVVALAA